MIISAPASASAFAMAHPYPPSSPIPATNAFLPFKSIVKTWGEEIYFEIPIEESLDLEKDAKDIINIGEIAYWIEGKCIAIGYGKTPISKGNEIKLAARTNIWGDALLNIKELNKIKDGDEVVVS